MAASILSDPQADLPGCHARVFDASPGRTAGPVEQTPRTSGLADNQIAVVYLILQSDLTCRILDLLRKYSKYSSGRTDAGGCRLRLFLVLDPHILERFNFVVGVTHRR